MAAKKSKNPALTAFMREKRGKRTADSLGKHLSFFYWRYESEGSLPQDEERLSALAKALGCTVVELTSFIKEPENNMLPMLKAIAESSLKYLTPEEFAFLLEMQKGFTTPLSSALAKELVVQRRSSEEWRC